MFDDLMSRSALGKDAGLIVCQRPYVACPEASQVACQYERRRRFSNPVGSGLAFQRRALPQTYDFEKYFWGMSKIGLPRSSTSRSDA